MLIAIRYPGVWVAIVLVLQALSSFAQEEDTVHTKPFERYWTKPRIVPKIGGGTQKTVFVEAGIQLHQIYVHPLALASRGPYFTVDGLMKKNDLVKDFIIGPKLGYEFTAGLLGLAADVTYYTDFNGHRATMFTPRAGISILGFADLFYGYNVPLSDYQFAAISRNRFSLVFNINRDYFSLRTAGKKPEKTR